MRQPTDVSLVKNYSLARRLHELGMMPTVISKYVPGTATLVRTFTDVNPELSFSRGYSKTWVRSHNGFKLSNILFKIYGVVSGDPTLKKGIDISYLAAAWEVAIFQYPELLADKICDISRFAYLLQKVSTNEYLVFQCGSSNCNNKFIIHETCDRTHCWACSENKILKSKEITVPQEKLASNAPFNDILDEVNIFSNTYTESFIISNLFLTLHKSKQECIPSETPIDPLRLVSNY